MLLKSIKFTIFFGQLFNIQVSLITLKTNIISLTLNTARATKQIVYFTIVTSDWIPKEILSYSLFEISNLKPPKS